jgi:predicted metal-binding transcription factor (methanogenesis marker protein 9)
VRSEVHTSLLACLLITSPCLFESYVLQTKDISLQQLDSGKRAPECDRQCPEKQSRQKANHAVADEFALKGVPAAR